MFIEITVPNLPESVSDATLLDWHKRPGDRVSKSDNLVDLETDKVVLEVPVPESGILKEIRRNKGDVVTSGDLLAVLETEVAGATRLPPDAVMVDPTPLASNDAPLATPVPVEPVAANPAPMLISSRAISPAVRRLLREHNLDPAEIPESAGDGRITRQTVLDYLQEKEARAAPVQSPPPTPRMNTAEVADVPTRSGDTRVPMTRLRARIAERMVEAQRTTATLTTFNEINLKKLADLRQDYRTRFEQQYGVKLGYMSFFVKATVEALKRFPIVNASVEGSDIITHDYYDIGIAVSTDRGLVVPVLRDADHADLASIERFVVEFSKKARDGKLTFDELTGGTFTITNGGVFGSMLSTPILNPPQSAILGMHAIKDRPVVENGEIVIRPMIYVALSYDHRIIDGRDAVSFLFTVKELLEDPVRLFLGV